jgi:N-acetylglucosamine malate deacetylase 1
MKLDILAFGAHPDDVELACSGLIIKEVNKGTKVGVIDLTEGELGTRGTVETRYQEANEAATILGLSIRENLNLGDGFFSNTKEAQLEVIKMLRKYRPEVVIANALHDRHPDHGKGADLLRDACFYSGLAKIESHLAGEKQEAWRPKALYFYIQDRYIEPDFVVDITQQWEQKLAAIKAYKTQFYQQEMSGPQTYISSPSFLNFVEARAREMGHKIGVDFGEGFCAEKKIGVDSIFDLKL